MEEDKKKKKKKKKNKQHRATENSAADGHGAPSQNHHSTESGKTSTALVDDTPDTQEDDTVLPINVDRETHLPKDAHSVVSAEKIKHFQQEKDAHKHKEVILEEKIQKLLQEKNVLLQTEATMLEKIEELQNDRAEHMHREASLEAQILLLGKEKDAYVQRVGALEQKIAQMQMEMEAHAQRESALEHKLGQLLSDNESWFHKEAHFEEKINHLVDEAATLSLKEVTFEEMLKQMGRERHSWILQENSSKEVIAKLSGDNSRLELQVAVSEELRTGLLQENQLLTESISVLQSQILNLGRTAVVSQSYSDSKLYTTENGDMASYSEAAHQVVDKLISEKDQLDGKVNELYSKFDHNGLQPETTSFDSSADVAHSTAVELLPVLGAIEMQNDPASDSMNEAGAKMLVPDIRVLSQEDELNSDVRGGGRYLNDQKTMLFSDSSKITKLDEIVQISLDENNKLADVEAPNDAHKTEIPLSDAPLIGAPFRLISFVARYVSGADLVEKNSVNSVR